MRRAALALAVGVYVAALGTVRQPTVHPFYDAVGIRDAGTVWSSLTWSIADERRFLPAAIMNHIEGPLQFVLLNVYYHLVGNRLPLNPSTTQVPNTVLALGVGATLYALGRRVDGARAGTLMALSFLLMPWIGMTIRVPWVFNMLSCLLEASTLLAYAALVVDPERRVYRVVAATSLALYFLTGLDWPLFIPILALFLVLNRRLLDAIRNPYNALPLIVVLAHGVWAVALWAYGNWYSPQRSHLWTRVLLVYPFTKVASSQVTLRQSLTYAGEAFGLGVPLMALVLFKHRWEELTASPPAVPRRLQWSLGIASFTWTGLGLIPLLMVAGDITYAYVVGVPIAVLSGLLLARWPVRTAGVAVAVMAAVQLGLTWTKVVKQTPTDDRRVIAAAAFLIEQRPDLLAADRTAFLPRDEPSNVGQYARGANARIVMPLYFPAERALRSVASSEPVLRDFVTAYEGQRTIRADWIILSSESLTHAGSSAGFFARLAADRQISWIASFPDHGRALWLGVVRSGGRTIAEAPVQDVGALASIYETRYDRIAFLERNVQYVLHY
jgi:hypothetical protein